ncbi:Zn(2)-Cys(6)binuclear cluster domain-containing protein [Moniliophthora roreri MCA 2997]|uniref:Zn(2)-Cys(6)binuclear cluster domain-containing protein n=1 Tax=Moniliophthora roreri (strain MCA 2997) TaxID=1381753 RepID=V2WSY9_MONRO|nr:Zn(2)-Cys(6)binuclear cluster domain-containing protein [Moniliophthora roreri MCA 2997]
MAPAGPSSSSRSQLCRGAACVRCRLRKTKCDGKRPVCGPCQAAQPNQCGYTDEAPWTTHTLEEKISVMESRLGDLQKSSESSSITLHHPYASDKAALNLPPPLDIRKLPTELRRSLINALLTRASNFNFFLETSRFAGPDSYPPSPALRSTTYLMGAYFNLDAKVSAQQPNLLTQALYDATQGLSVDHPHRTLHLIQAEVILGQYFLLNGRLTEARYHTCTAISLVLGASFHKIRAKELLLTPGLDNLPPPVDSLEEVERVNALWTVLIINHCWTAAHDAASNIAYERSESRVDAPWPLDISSQSQFPDDLRSSDTIQEFLENAEDDGNGNPLLTIKAKAAILYEQGSRLSQGYTPNMSLHDGARFQSSFLNLNNHIRRFISALPPIRTDSRSSVIVRQLLFIHTLARMALIQLHRAFTGKDASSHALTLLTAEEIVACSQGVKLHDFPFIDPFMSFLWVATAKIFIEEIGNVCQSASNREGPPRRSHKDLSAQVEIIMSVMAIFAPHSPLFDAQLARVQKNYTAALQ